MKKLFLIVTFLLSISYANCQKESTINITDFHGNSYKTVKIGNQIWMAENLKATRNSKGDKLDGVFAYDNSEENVKTYGRLYKIDAAIKACPEGWHVPTKEDWEELINYLGGEKVAGGKMKVPNNELWDSPNKDATNASKFNAIPAGMYDFTKVFQWFGKTACFLSATSSPAYVKCYYIENSSGNLKSGNFHPMDAASVRLIKD